MSQQFKTNKTKTFEFLLVFILYSIFFIDSSLNSVDMVSEGDGGREGEREVRERGSVIFIPLISGVRWALLCETLQSGKLKTQMFLP